MAVVIDRAEGRARSARLAIAVAGDLAVLGYFKYADFFLVSVHERLCPARPATSACRCSR